jgi:hypothetical protein
MCSYSRLLGYCNALKTGISWHITEEALRCNTSPGLAWPGLVRIHCPFLNYLNSAVYSYQSLLTGICKICYVTKYRWHGISLRKLSTTRCMTHNIAPLLTSFWRCTRARPLKQYRAQRNRPVTALLAPIDIRHQRTSFLMVDGILLDSTSPVPFACSFRRREAEKW